MNCLAVFFCLLSTQAGGFKHAGGDVYDLVNEVAQAKGKPVVSVFYEPDAIPKFTISSPSADNEKDFRRLFKTKAGWIVDSSEGIALSQERLPLPEKAPDDYSNRELKGAKHVYLDKDVISDGKIALSSESGTAFLASDLEKLDLGKPLKLHWLYRHIALVANVKSCPVPVFLKLVAQSMGAEFSETSDGFSLAFDATQYRVRAIGSVDRGDIKPSPIRPLEIWRADIRVMREIYRTAPDEILNKLFERRGVVYGFDVPKDAQLQYAINAKIGALKKYGSQMRPDDIERMKEINWNSPIKASMGQDFSAGTFIGAKSGGSMGF